MTPLVILSAILIAPILLMMALRINAALVFLSLCLGDVLVQFIGPDAGAIVASTSAHAPSVAGVMSANQSYTNVVLLLLPVVLTMLIMIHSVRGGAKLAFNLLPSIGVGLLGALLAVPLLTSGATNAITSVGLWHQLSNLQSLILGVSTLLCLGFLWLQRPKHHKEESKHH